MAVQWLVNGEAGRGVDPGDRGLAYGDGLFETMAVSGGAVPRLAYHFERLVEGSDRLGIPRPDLGAAEREIAAQAAGLERAVAKLIVTRGSGGRGYAPPAQPEPTRILGIFPWPAYDAAHYTRGIVVETLDVTIAENPRLAGLKHLCRLEQVLARRELGERRADEGLVRRAGGELVGGSSTNVFIVREGRVGTPGMDTCGVAGVMRRIVIETCVREGLACDEVELRDADLRAADELFVTNAVAGVRPVRELDGRAYALGPVTRRLMRATDVETV